MDSTRYFTCATARSGFLYLIRKAPELPFFSLLTDLNNLLYLEVKKHNYNMLSLRVSK